MTKKYTASSSFESIDCTDTSSSSVLNNPFENNEYIATSSVGKYALGFFLLVLTTPISADVSIVSSARFASSTTLECHYNIEDSRSESDILLGFISNLINNSEDLDGRIVDMVNEDFWDLI